MKVKTYKKQLSCFGYRQLMVCTMLAYNYANGIGTKFDCTFKEYFEQNLTIKLTLRDIAVFKDISCNCVGMQWIGISQTMDKMIFDFLPNISKITDERILNMEVHDYIKEKYYD